MFLYYVLLLASQFTHNVVLEELGDYCPQNASVEHLDAGARLYIVKLVNNFRNHVADGHPHFNAACRIRIMQWSDTLAAIAAARVSQFIKSAQNAVNHTYNAQSQSLEEFAGSTSLTEKLNFSIRKWMEQRIYTNQTTMNSCPDTRNSVNRIDDFLHLITETNTQIGCASTSYPSRRRTEVNFLLVCAFEQANKVGHPVYKSCLYAAADCTAIDDTYGNLCDMSEQYESPTFGPSCPPNAREVHFSQPRKQFLVNKINAIRNYTAGGRNSKLKPACDMKTVEWSNTLAIKAAARVRQCGARMDNHYFRGHSHAYLNYRVILDVYSLVTNVIDMWHREGNYVNQSIINSYPDTENFTNLYDDLLNILKDSNDAVGCSATTYPVNKRRRFAFFIDCVFEKTNRVGRPVYHDCDNPAEHCQRRNPVYQNLCSSLYV